MALDLRPKSVLLAAALVALATGCTLIGAGIGEGSSPGENPRELDRSEIDQIPTGKKVTVRMLTGGHYSGNFDSAWRNPDGTLDPSAIALVDGGRRRRIAVGDIHSVTIAGKPGGALVGAGIGLAADVALVALAVSASRSSGGSGGSGGEQSAGSCPLIYSVDGTSRHLDAEVLVATVFPGLDRTDFVRLEHAKAENGEIRIEVEGQLGETQRALADAGG